MTISPPPLAPEGGRLYLAEALFAAYPYTIRCPSCVGNEGRPGFIKDSAGKSTKDGLNRRQWRCQRSNGRGVDGSARCGRTSCTEYINLARGVLSAQQFGQVLKEVSDRHPPSLETNSALQGICYTEYQHRHRQQSDSSSSTEPSLVDRQPSTVSSNGDGLQPTATSAVTLSHHRESGQSPPANSSDQGLPPRSKTSSSSDISDPLPQSTEEGITHPLQTGGQKRKASEEPTGDQTGAKRIQGDRLVDRLQGGGSQPSRSDDQSCCGTDLIPLNPSQVLWDAWQGSTRALQATVDECQHFERTILSLLTTSPASSPSSSTLPSLSQALAETAPPRERSAGPSPSPQHPDPPSTDPKTLDELADRFFLPTTTGQERKEIRAQAKELQGSRSFQTILRQRRQR